MNDVLNKIQVKKVIGYIYNETKDNSITKFLEEIKNLEKKGEKEGFKNIKVSIGMDCGDENNLETYFVEIHGERFETDEEWHKRLDEMQRRTKNELENAQRIINLKDHFENKIKEIDKALENSPLKCEDCGVPSTITMFYSGWKKNRRLCSRCLQNYRK